MPETASVKVAIVDYGMGNLFSVRHACQAVGLQATITHSPEDIRMASAVILPGVGAFGDAMATLWRCGLAEALLAAAESGKPFLGVCLGMQLLMQESREFGRHKGLGIVEGDVVRFENRDLGSQRLKVPQVGWNSILLRDGESWDQTYLKGIPSGAFMYFVHSFYVRPVDEDLILAQTRYGEVTFTSSLRKGNVFACQFHPERSGDIGIQVYRNFAKHVMRSTMEMEHA